MSPGTTISHFRIVSQLGRGGMGIVYKAEDTKLDRTVALKLLPPHALTSEDDKARFYREARAAAALNHPNIAHVYEIDEAMAEGESRPFIAMEFIDGETLADRIASGPLPMKDTISIATQIAEGLKAAHRKDVVHRDVKSGNVMITKDGVVKVLDFGLAKTAASTKLTQMGSTLGTVAYMSPEQAKGEDVDRRTDIWSLGVILYEMITGRLPFRGDYEQAVVYGILNEDPESMTTLRAGVPLALDGIVAKLLAKDPGLRYQNVDELPADLKRIDLDSTATHSRLSTTVVGSPAKSKQTSRSDDRVRSRFASLGIAALALSLGFVLAWAFKPDDPESVRRYTMSLDPNPAREWLSISANGEVLAFTSGAQGQIYVKTRTDFRPRSVPYAEGSPIVSPSGEWIAFFADGSWKRVGVDGGGRPTELIDPGGLVAWADWKTEEVIAIATSEGIVELDLQTGSRTPITRSDSNSAHAFPQYVGRRGLIFTELWLSNLDSSLVKAVNLETGEISVIDPRPRMARYLNSGHLLYSEATWRQPASEWTLWAAPFDARTFHIDGPAVPVLEGASFASVAVSDNGMVAWGAGKVLGGTTISPRNILSVALDGSESLFVEETKPYMHVAFSRTGGQVAVTVGSLNSAWGDSEIWIHDVESGVGTQLTFGHWSGFPIWLPDPDHLVYYSDRDTSTSTVWVQRADGSEPAVAFVESKRELFPSSVHPDGRVLAFEEDEGHVVLLNGAAGTEEIVLEVENARLQNPRFSPDGNWIAYQSDELGKKEVFVTAFPSTGARWRISSDGGHSPLWSPDGRLIYYRSDDGDVMSAAVSTEGGFRRIGAPEALFERSGFVGWDIEPGGRAFLASAQGVLDSERSSNVYVIENWFEELNQIAPAGD